MQDHVIYVSFMQPDFILCLIRLSNYPATMIGRMDEVMFSYSLSLWKCSRIDVPPASCIYNSPFARLVSFGDVTWRKDIIPWRHMISGNPSIGNGHCCTHVVHNVALYRCSGAQRRAHKPRWTNMQTGPILFPWLLMQKVITSTDKKSPRAELKIT